MTNKERNIIKKKILKCLTEDFKDNQAIFDKQVGLVALFNNNSNLLINA